MNSYQPRHRARKYALQALYSWHISQNNLADIQEHILEGKNLAKIDMDYFQKLLHEVPENLNEINKAIVPHIKIPLEQLDPVELVSLQMATFELLYCIDVPPKVVVNEALELNKKFGAEDGYKFVNAVLDKVLRSKK